MVAKCQHREGNLPVEIFYSLPEWSVYVETPGITLPCLLPGIAGFFAHLEYDPHDSHHELRLVCLADNLQLYPIPIHLGEWTLAESMRRAVDRAIEAARIAGPNLPVWAPSAEELVEHTAAHDEAVTPLLNLLLYICSINADYDAERPIHPSHRPTSKKGRVVAANEVRTWNIGIRVGAALRKATTQAPSAPTSITRASPRPHYRRAHWHHFWIGPRSKPEERKLTLKWLLPISVGIGDMDETPVVVRKIRPPE